MKALLFALLLAFSALAISHDSAEELPSDIEIYQTCIKGYLYVIVRDENGIDIEQMTEPSEKGMVKTPLPIRCKG